MGDWIDLLMRLKPVQYALYAFALLVPALVAVIVDGAARRRRTPTSPGSVGRRATDAARR